MDNDDIHREKLVAQLALCNEFEITDISSAMASIKDELLQKVWGYNLNVSTHTVETHVYRLRQKIEPIKGAFTLVKTTRDGYRLELS